MLLPVLHSIKEWAAKLGKKLPAIEFHASRAKQSPIQIQFPKKMHFQSKLARGFLLTSFLYYLDVKNDKTSKESLIYCASRSRRIHTSMVDMVR